MPTETPGATGRPLLGTKTSIPQVRPDYVRRDRLVARLDRGAIGPLTLLSAPAGFGKTNLLVQWAAATNLPVAWLTLDSGDGDVTRLFRYLVGALQTRQAGLGEEALDFVEVTRGAGLEEGLTLLINEVAALQKQLALVLDDFQSIEEPAALRCITYLLRHLPANLHLLIACRGEPDLDLALPRAMGWVTELDADDLRFTTDEVDLFFRQTMGLALPPTTVQALQQRTDGWVTGLQLAAISLRDEPDAAALLANLQGDARYLAAFLSEEVLDKQPEEVRQFMLRSSVLELLTGPLCEAVVNPAANPGYGSVMLHRLAHENLFIVALDENEEWFRYHPLFGDFLRHVETEINPTEVPVLHRRAAVWFEQHSSLDDACRHALASGDLEWMADLIERNVQTMIARGEVRGLVRWIGELPDELIHRRLSLCLAYAWAAIASYRLDLAERWLDDAQRSLEQAAGPSTPEAEPGRGSTACSADSALWDVRDGLAICRSTLAVLSGDMQRAAAYSREAAGHLQKENPFARSLLALDESLYRILSGDTQEAIRSLRHTVDVSRQGNNLLAMVIAMCQLAEMQALQGQLSKALVTLQKARYAALGPDGEPLPLAGLVDVGLGQVLFERNALSEASTYLERGYQTAHSLWLPSSLDAMVSVASLRQAQGDISGVQAILAEASNMALSTESSQWDDTIVSAVAARLALLRGDLAEAEQWWARAGFPDIGGAFALERYPYHIFEYLVLVQSRFLFLRGQDTGDRRDLRQAARLLGSLRIEAERLRRTASLIEMLVLQALVQAALDDAHAHEPLLAALALGEPEGFRRTYLDEGRRLLPLLSRCRAAPRAAGRYLPSRAFIDGLLAELETEGCVAQPVRMYRGTASAGATAADGPPVLLSAREMEVLRLIADGKSNQEIAARLYLALNTVKRHAYNIYAKLDVNKRTHAVSKARQMGLLP